jgi:hypothetical protein
MLRKKGYSVRFAPEVLYWENENIQCAKCRVQSCSFTMTNLLFLASSFRLILNSKMKWFEKLDLYLFLSSVPSAIVYALYLLNALLTLTLMNFSLHYTLEVQLPLILLLTIPLAIHARYQLQQNSELILKTANTWGENVETFYIALKDTAQIIYRDLILIPKARKMYQKLLLNSK